MLKVKVPDSYGLLSSHDPLIKIYLGSLELFVTISVNI